MRFARAFLYVLLAAAPLGTRLIFRVGEIDGVAVEPGTVSIFATQVLVLCFAVAAVVAGRRRVHWFGAFAVAAVALAAFAAASSLWATDPQGSAVNAGFLAFGVLVLIGIAISRPDPAIAARWLVGGAAAQAALGSWQSFAQQVSASTVLGVARHAPGDLGAFVVETAGGRWLRAYGTMPHPNVYALYLALGIFCAVGLYARAKGARERAAALGTVAFLAAGMTVAFSRGAFLALLAGIAVMAWRSRQDGRDARTRLAVAACCVALAAAAMGLVHRDVVMTRLSGEGRLESVSTAERRSQLGDALTLFADHPFIGTGIGQMPLALSLRHPDDRNPWAYQYVHNIFLLAAVELGVIGLALFAAALGMWVRAIRKRGLGTVPPQFLAAAIAILTIGLVDHFPWSLWQGQLLLWMILGLSVYSETRSDA